MRHDRGHGSCWKADANAHEALGMVLVLLALASDPANCLAVTEQAWCEQSRASRTGSPAAEMLLSKLGTAQVWFVPPQRRGCAEVDTVEHLFP